MGASHQEPISAAKRRQLYGDLGAYPPGNFCNFNAPKVDFEASGTYFGSIGTKLANDAAVQ